MFVLPEKDGRGRAGRVEEKSPEWGVTGDLGMLLIFPAADQLLILPAADQMLIVPGADQGIATGFSLRHYKGFLSLPALIYPPTPIFP